jgi:diguanylate cyclase (GGDEF)-like protein
MASLPLEVDGKQVASTVSIGLASLPEDGVTLEAIVARADRAMYQAKSGGRDRVVRFAEVRPAAA